MRPTLVLASMLGVFGVAQGGAQPIDSIAPQLSRDIAFRRLDPSYIYPTRGLSKLEPMLFEASLSPQYFISLWRRGAVVLTPAIVVRMRSGAGYASLPIRTPSYNPKITALLWRRTRVESGKSLTYLSLAFAHYSNGQEGPFLDSTGAVNHVNGNFSTNYADAALHYVATSPIGDMQTLTVGVQYHVRLSMDPGMRGRYSHVRPRIVSEVFVPRMLTRFARPALGERWRNRVEIGYLAGRVDPALRKTAERVTASVTWTFQPPWMQDLGLMLNYYEGQDYYNIWFDRRIRALRLGVVGRTTSSVFRRGT